MPERTRARRLAWSAVLALTVASALALSATAMILPRATQAVATPVSVRQLVEEGDQQLAAEDFAGALKSYDRAMSLDRRDLTAYYRAGVALSYLGEREQTATLFLWVVRYGPPDREEAPSGPRVAGGRADRPRSPRRADDRRSLQSPREALLDGPPPALRVLGHFQRPGDRLGIAHVECGHHHDAGWRRTAPLPAGTGAVSIRLPAGSVRSCGPPARG